MKPPWPYYYDDSVGLYHGDFTAVLRELVYFNNPTGDAAIVDPPYGATSLEWDQWPRGWPLAVADALPATTSMWCFGSLRMFLDRQPEFRDGGWRLGEDIVWEKPNGTGFGDPTRHLRVHESVGRFYRGQWAGCASALPRTRGGGADKSAHRQSNAAAHRSEHGARAYSDDGLRQPRSVLRYPSVRYQGRNETEKPVGLVAQLIESLVPPGGCVLDPMAGSGTTGEAAKLVGRRAVLIESREDQCAATAARLRNMTLPDVPVDAAGLRDQEGLLCLPG